MIESFTFTNYGSGSTVTFNDNEVPFRNLNIERERRMDTRPKARRHGLWPSYQYYGGMVLRAEGEILRQNSTQYMQKRMALQEVLRPTPHLGNFYIGKLEVLFTGVEEVYAECTLDGDPELPIEAMFPSAGEYMIPWLSFSPYFKSTEDYSAEIGTPGLTDGRTYSKTYPMSYSGSGASNDVVATNSGNTETFPIITILGPCDSPRLTLIGPVEELMWELDGLSIPAGASAIADFEHRTVVDNTGAIDWYSFAKGSWWALEPGNNTVEFTAFSAAEPCMATISWQHNYVI